MFWAFIKKTVIIIPAPFFSKKGFFTSLQISDEMIVACRTKQSFFALSGASNLRFS